MYLGVSLYGKFQQISHFHSPTCTSSKESQTFSELTAIPSLKVTGQLGVSKWNVRTVGEDSFASSSFGRDMFIPT